MKLKNKSLKEILIFTFMAAIVTLSNQATFGATHDESFELLATPGFKAWYEKMDPSNLKKINALIEDQAKAARITGEKGSHIYKEGFYAAGNKPGNRVYYLPTLVVEGSTTTLSSVTLLSGSITKSEQDKGINKAKKDLADIKSGKLKPEKFTINKSEKNTDVKSGPKAAPGISGEPFGEYAAGGAGGGGDPQEAPGISGEPFGESGGGDACYEEEEELTQEQIEEIIELQKQMSLQKKQQQARGGGAARKR